MLIFQLFQIYSGLLSRIHSICKAMGLVNTHGLLIWKVLWRLFGTFVPFTARTPLLSSLLVPGRPKKNLNCLLNDKSTLHLRKYRLYIAGTILVWIVCKDFFAAQKDADICLLMPPAAAPKQLSHGRTQVITGRRILWTSRNKVPWEKNGQREIHCFWLGGIPSIKNRNWWWKICPMIG